MTSNKNNNKSLFLYTGLIFIVAFLLIILSFFGQTNLEKKQPKIDEEQQQALSGITERAAVLSEENKNLIEENTVLKTENEELIAKQTENNLLLSANAYFTSGDNDKAYELILSVNYDNLSDDQKVIYDAINDVIQAVPSENNNEQ